MFFLKKKSHFHLRNYCDNYHDYPLSISETAEDCLEIRPKSISQKPVYHEQLHQYRSMYDDHFYKKKAGVTTSSFCRGEAEITRIWVY